MNPSGHKKGAGWRHLLIGAASDDKEKRIISLVRAYAWVEHALDAAQVPGPRKPISRRILGTLNDSRLSKGLSEDLVRTAIGIRHIASHEDTVPAPQACVSAVETLRDVWHALSRHFVNTSTALSIGYNMVNTKGIESVCLFGSMARGFSEPNDIDFLVLDDGRYSSRLEFVRYKEGTFNAVKSTKDALCLLEIASTKLVRCAECRWLDILIVDGHKFGHDREYTELVRVAQPDPWFFVNMSNDLKEYDRASSSFVLSSRFPFAELRSSRTDIERLGFL